VFEADTPMKMFVQHLQSPPVPPSERSELPISSELDDLVLACLAKNPEDRPQSVDELLRRLERVPVRSPWTNDAARQWWDAHLVELAAPMPASPLDRPHTTLAVA
jgi:serine/threonine protein kinase